MILKRENSVAFIAVLLCLFGFMGNQRGLTSFDLISFKKRITDRLSPSIRSHPVLKSISANFEILTVPNCFVDSEGFDEESLKRNFVDNLAIDSVNIYSILLSKGEIVAIVSGVDPIDYTLSPSSFNTPELAMIKEVVRKYSRDPFLISFSELNPRNQMVGFFRNDSLLFLDEKLRIVRSVKEIVVQQNGTIEKYREAISMRNRKSRLQKSLYDIETSREMVASDYHFYSRAFPKDTTKVLELLFNEVRQTCGLSAPERSLILGEIVHSLKDRRFMFSGSGVPLFGVDIAPCFKSILTRDRYVNFIENRSIKSWVATRASDRIYIFLRLDRQIPEKEIDKEFKKFVFGMN